MFARFSTKLEEIKFADFIDDHNPIFVLLVTLDKIHHRSVFRILRLRDPNAQTGTHLSAGEGEEKGEEEEYLPGSLAQKHRLSREEKVTPKIGHSSAGFISPDSMANNLCPALLKESVISEPSHTIDIENSYMLDQVRHEEMQSLVLHVALTRCHFGEFLAFVGADNVLRTRIIKTYEFDREECPLYEQPRDYEEHKPFLAFTPHISDDSRYLMIDNKKERFAKLEDSVRSLAVFEDVIAVLYRTEPALDFFNLNTALLQRVKLNELMTLFEIQDDFSFRHVSVMRLRWSDRNTGLAGQGMNKVALAGHDRQENFVVLLVPANLNNSSIVFVDFEVSAVAFGPYDNAYLMLGGAGGELAVVDPTTAEVLYKRKLMGAGVSGIAFDPTNLVLVSATDGQVKAVSLEKRKEHYVYIELGRRNYRTLKYPLKQGSTKI